MHCFEQLERLLGHFRATCSSFRVAAFEDTRDVSIHQVFNVESDAYSATTWPNAMSYTRQ